MWALIITIFIILILYLVWIFRKRPKRATDYNYHYHYIPDRLPCHYCGTEVTKDFILVYRSGDFSNVVCGKIKCLKLYTEENEQFTNNEKTGL